MPISVKQYIEKEDIVILPQQDKYMKLAIFFLGVVSMIAANAQQRPKENWLKLSGGHVSLGTGDLLGYSVAVEFSHNTVKNPAWGKDKLLLGGEFIFESSVINPAMRAESVGGIATISLNSFAQVASSLLWAKASYYPIHRILNGFHISLGPTMGYSDRTFTELSTISIDVLGNITRRVTLLYDNGFTIGYRVSTGIEFPVAKKYMAGFRLDWSNNQLGEIKTLAGLRLGINF